MSYTTSEPILRSLRISTIVSNSGNDWTRLKTAEKWAEWLTNPVVSFIELLTALRGYTKIYNEGIFRIWFGWQPLLILSKPDTCEQVLSNNFLLDKSSQYSLLHPWLGTGLLTSSGNKWRARRKMLIPAFHFKILHDFVPVFNEQGMTLAKKLSTIANQPNCVDIVPLVTACTLDIICG